MNGGKRFSEAMPPAHLKEQIDDALWRISNDASLSDFIFTGFQ
jgi:hypothetical protein